MLEWLFFVAPILPIAASVVCSLIFFVFAFAVAYYTYVACITDPIDVYLQKHVQDARRSSSYDAENVPPPSCRSKLCYRGPDTTNITLPHNEDEIKYCWVCETSVAEHSMHCKYCNKCVSHFDHHCLWLNTCVGEANYPYFYKILWSTCGMLVVHTCCMVGIVIDVFVGGSSEQRADAWFGLNQSNVVAGVNIFFILSNMVSLSAVAQLLNFHIGLQRKNLTTYQYIITDNARRREATQKKEERNAKRTTAVTKARQEGKPILALRLQVGEYCCPPCDALPPDEEAPVAVTAAETNGDDPQQTSSGYAALGDDDDEAVFTAEDEEKTSMTSERDLARTNAASLGASSSSQLEHKQEDGAITAGESMSSETDLARTNATSLGESSSSHMDEKRQGGTEKSTLDESSPVASKQNKVNGGSTIQNGTDNGGAAGQQEVDSNGSSNVEETTSSEINDSSESRTADVARMNEEEQNEQEKDPSSVENT